MLNGSYTSSESTEKKYASVCEVGGLGPDIQYNLFSIISTGRLVLDFFAEEALALLIEIPVTA